MKLEEQDIKELASSRFYRANRWKPIILIFFAFIPIVAVYPLESDLAYWLSIGLSLAIIILGLLWWATKLKKYREELIEEWKKEQEQSGKT